ncbi:MAG: TRAP transporter small permease subunit [Pseudomonadota bacterium]
MLDAFSWFFSSLFGGLQGLLWVILHPAQAFDFSNGEAVLRFAYYGGSDELAVLVLTIAFVVFVVGTFRHAFLWSVVTGIESISNTIGRICAWAGLIMVLQQVMVIFLQSMFRVAEISIGPFGVAFTQPIGWYADGLKLYNAIVIALCCAYTFVQRGHVRVDLVYSAVSFRTKKVLDMIMTLIFMVPVVMLIWFYGWFYMWRHLIRPNISATDDLDRVLARARAFRWDVETFSASPSGFNAYFIFKLLIILFAATMLLQAFGFFYRSYLEWREGPEAEGKGLDLDRLDQPAPGESDDSPGLEAR